jgi:hypothetical protein
MVKFHTVSLSEVERGFLHRTISAGTAPARVTRRARVLLKADAADEGPGWQDAMIAEATEVSVPTIERLRKRAATEGVEPAIADRPRRASMTMTCPAIIRLAVAVALALAILFSVPVQRGGSGPAFC